LFPCATQSNQALTDRKYSAEWAMRSPTNSAQKANPSFLLTSSAARMVQTKIGVPLRPRREDYLTNRDGCSSFA
jgi:hypothetical protein